MMAQRRRNDSTASCSVGSDDHDAAPPPVDYYRDVWEEFACNGRDADLEPPSPDDDDRALRDAQAWWTCQQQQQQPSHAHFYSGQQARQWRRQGGRGEEGGGSFPPSGWTSKNYVICVCFHCHGTSSYHTTNTLQGRRAKSQVDTQTIQSGLGDFVL